MSKTKTKPADDASADEAPAPAPIHVVLYVRPEPGLPWKPMCSHPEGHDDIADDHALLKQDAIRAATASGAVRPAFKVVTEQKGKPLPATAPATTE